MQPAPHYLARHRDGRTYEARTLPALCMGIFERWGVRVDAKDLARQLAEDHATAYVHDDGASPNDALVTVLDRERVGF